MASPLQFAYRTQKAIGVFDAAPAYAPLSGFVKPEGNLRCCIYSPCGRYFAWASNEGVSVVDASTGQVLASLPLTAVYELGFSPRGTFIATWERPSKDEAGDATKNLKIWRTIEESTEEAANLTEEAANLTEEAANLTEEAANLTEEAANLTEEAANLTEEAANLTEDAAKSTEETAKLPLGQFVQKSQNGWNLQYTADEKYCARLVTNEVQFYDSNDLKTVWNKLRVEGVTDFALAPGSTHNLAVFIPERKGQPAAVKVFNVPQFANPISQKTFFKGDKVQLKWNQQGSSLIVLAQTDVDKSNKSYYGETTMYLLSANGAFDARVTLDKEGPIHDVAWSPNGREFGVIYGYMPAKTTIFNHRGVATHSFPMGPRNTIIFSPTGRFVLVAGFGNLAGQIDVYDLEKDHRKVCTIESGNPSVCQWSPDSVYIMTATTSPRLRVDNGVKLWHVGGAIMYTEEMVELYNVIWRPQPADQLPKNLDPLNPVPEPHESAVAYLGTVKTPSKPVGAYRPPGARGTSTPLHFKREDEGGAAHVMGNGSLNGFGRSRQLVPGAPSATGRPQDGPTPVPGAELGEQFSKTALKNKKKRGNKKTKDTAGTLAGGNEGELALPSQEAERGDRRGGRSRSRHPQNDQGRSRSNTQRNESGRANGPRDQNPSGQDQPAETAEQAPAQGNDSGANQAQNPNAKKMRGLQKKIRAIEDLEMRLAGGEKLEDTQMKKIGTKVSVLKELETLEKGSA